MAIVNLTADVITTIVGNVRKVYETDRAKIDSKVPTVPGDIGTRLHGLIIPLETQKQIQALLPEWGRATQNAIGVRVRGHGSTNWNHASVVCMAVSGECVAIGCSVDILDIPGIEKLTWDGYTISMTLAEKASELLPLSDNEKAFLIKLTEIKGHHEKLTKTAKEAGDSMRRFLEQHRTVQQAMKAFGPAMKAYIDPWLQQELDRVPPTITRKKKVPKPDEVVDVSKLIAKATAKQLNI